MDGVPFLSSPECSDEALLPKDAVLDPEGSSQRLMDKGLVPQLLLMLRGAWVVRMLISSTANPCNRSQLPGRWGLVEGSRALGHVSEGCVLSLDHLLLSASCLSSDLQLSTMAFCCDCLLSLISMEPTMNQKFETEQNKHFLPSGLSGILSQQCKLKNRCLAQGEVC